VLNGIAKRRRWVLLSLAIEKHRASAARAYTNYANLVPTSITTNTKFVSSDRRDRSTAVSTNK
jgi:hypothetical protein